MINILAIPWRTTEDLKDRKWKDIFEPYNDDDEDDMPMHLQFLKTRLCNEWVMLNDAPEEPQAEDNREQDDAE